jgi:uncharacterized RDD family membrane protein YckC
MEPSIEIIASSKSDIVYAGFILRLLAYFIDRIILLMPEYFLEKVVMSYFENPSQPIKPLLYEAIANVLLYSLYYGIMESSFLQGTLGKQIMGLRVSKESGERLSLYRAALRGLCIFFSWTSFGLGFAIIALTPKKQALHDIAAQCLVVRMESRSGPVRILGFQV